MENPFPIIFPLAKALVLALFASLGVHFFTDSVSRAFGLFFVLWMQLLVWFYNVPPFQATEIFHGLFFAYALVAAIECFTVTQNGWRQAWLEGIIFFLAGVGFVLLKLVDLAYKNFRNLPEIDDLETRESLPPTNDLLASHATDIHITQNLQARLDGGPCGQDHLNQWLRTIYPMGTPYLIISGDVTDRGNVAEWNTFETSLKANGVRDGCVLISPGNHDLCCVYGTGGKQHLQTYFEVQSRWCSKLVTAHGRSIATLLDDAQTDIDSAESVELMAKALRNVYVKTASARPTSIRATEMGPRLGPPDPSRYGSDPETEARKTAELIDWKARAIDYIASHRRELVDDWFDRQWHTLFPLRLDDRERKLAILLLNSNIHALTSLGASGLGYLGPGQIERLRSTVEEVRSSAETIIILTHHAPFRRKHVTLPTFVGWLAHLPSLKAVWGTVQEFALLVHEVSEAKSFVQLLTTTADKHPSITFVLCCGHRHRAWAGRAGRVIILEGGCLADKGASAWLIFNRSGELWFKDERISESVTQRGQVRC